VYSREKEEKERGERLSASFRAVYRLPEKILKIVKVGPEDPDVAGWTVLEFFLSPYSHVITVMYARSPPDGF